MGIVGSRSFDEAPVEDLHHLLNLGLNKLYHIGIETNDIGLLVSGLAKGADMVTVDLSLAFRIPFIGYVPEWKFFDIEGYADEDLEGHTSGPVYVEDVFIEELGKNMTAGFERNSYIVDHVDFAVVIWDGESNGTQDTMDKLERANKPYVLVTQNVKAFRDEGKQIGKFEYQWQDVKKKIKQPSRSKNS